MNMKFSKLKKNFFPRSGAKRKRAVMQCELAKTDVNVAADAVPGFSGAGSACRTVAENFAFHTRLCSTLSVLDLACFVANFETDF